MYLCLGQEDDENDGCKKPGNPLCNPSTWKGYSNGCCSVEEQCGEEEGDCNQDSECLTTVLPYLPCIAEGSSGRGSIGGGETQGEGKDDEELFSHFQLPFFV